MAGFTGSSFLIFLWTASSSLEDFWGRTTTVGVYVATGIGGALAHAAAVSDSMVPMVGASGTVSGLMAAFLFQLHHREIRFYYLYFLFTRLRSGTFTGRAWVCIPIWLAFEARSTVIAAGFCGTGVAHWAHLGGFFAGGALAFGMKDLKWS